VLTDDVHREVHERFAGADPAGAAALARTHRSHPALTPPVDPVAPVGQDELVAVAGHWDAHPAKLVEACHRGHQRRGDHLFLVVARRVLGG